MVNYHDQMIHKKVLPRTKFLAVKLQQQKGKIRRLTRVAIATSDDLDKANKTIADQAAINLDMQEQINNLVKELQEVKSMAGKENALMTVLLAQGTEHNTIVKSIRERGNMLMADIITTFQERYETVGNLIGRMEQHLAESRQAARDLQGEVAPLRRYLTQNSERAADAAMQADIAKRLAGITFYKFVEMDCVARGDVLLNSGAGMTDHLSDLARQNMDMLVESLRMLPSSQRPLDIFLGRM
jgi:hypothetical protein